MSSSEYYVVGAHTSTIFSLYRFVMHSTSSANLGLIMFTLPKYSVSISCLSETPIHAWPLFFLEWYSRWPLFKVTKHLSGLLTSEIPTRTRLHPIPTWFP